MPRSQRKGKTNSEDHMQTRREEERRSWWNTDWALQSMSQSKRTLFFHGMLWYLRRLRMVFISTSDLYHVRDAVIIHRLCIGHTRLTHGYLLSGTDQPECSACHCPLTVKHILIECPALISSRNKHFTASSMKGLFDNVAARNIINFIKESHFYSTV